MADEQTKSRLQRFKDYIVERKKEKPEYEELPLSGDSVRIVADRKLKERLDARNKGESLINEAIPSDITLYKYVGHLLDKLQIANIIVQDAIVYARAGDPDNIEAKHLTHGWNHLFGGFYARTSRAQKFWGTNEPMTDARHDKQSINTIVIQKSEMGLHNILFKYYNDAVAWCYKDLDVRPGVVTTIQTMIPSNRQVDMTKAFSED